MRLLNRQSNRQKVPSKTLSGMETSLSICEHYDRDRTPKSDFVQNAALR